MSMYTQNILVYVCMHAYLFFSIHIDDTGPGGLKLTVCTIFEASELAMCHALRSLVEAVMQRYDLVSDQLKAYA